MSVLTYNGITLPYAHCTQFEQTPLYDEIGQVDWYVTRYDITVQSIISSDYLAMLDTTLIDVDEPLTNNPAEIMGWIRNQLLKPRKTLSYTFNGVELIPKIQTGITGTVDANQGPVPRFCQIFNLTNTTFLIRFSIVAHYWEKDQKTTDPLARTNAAGCPVIYNRWTETVNIDSDNYTTRIREGKYRIRSDNVEGFTADQFRNDFAVVSVPDGFMRQSSQYSLTPDGLGLQYRIIDQEIFKYPPQGAFRAEGTYVETSVKNGAKRIGDAQVTLYGPKNMAQIKLLDMAIAICTSKLILGDAAGNFQQPNFGPGKTPDAKGGFKLLISCVLKVDMYKNVVQAHLQALMNAASVIDPKQRIHGIAGLRGGKAITTTPLSDTNPGANAAVPVGVAGGSTTPKYSTRGTSNLLLIAAAYYDPSLSTNAMSLKKHGITGDNEVTNTGDSAVQTGTNRREPGQAGKKPE